MGARSARPKRWKTVELQTLDRFAQSQTIPGLCIRRMSMLMRSGVPALSGGATDQGNYFKITVRGTLLDQQRGLRRQEYPSGRRRRSRARNRVIGVRFCLFRTSPQPSRRFVPLAHHVVIAGLRRATDRWPCRIAGLFDNRRGFSTPLPAYRLPGTAVDTRAC